MMLKPETRKSYTRVFGEESARLGWKLHPKVFTPHGNILVATRYVRVPGAYDEHFSKEGAGLMVRCALERDEKLRTHAFSYHNTHMAPGSNDYHPITEREAIWRAVADMRVFLGDLRTIESGQTIPVQ